MGGSKGPEVTQIPLMSQPQNQLLDQLLSFIPQAMGGVQLGEAYGGPQQSSYSPFTIPGGGGGGKGGPPIGSKDESSIKSRGDISREVDRERRTDRRGERDDSPVGREFEAIDVEQARRRDRTRIPNAVLDEILNPLPSTTNIPNVRIPESQPISPIQQALTEPIISPFREGMTGNFARRRGER